MKLKNNFVTNSSTTNFIVVNTTEENKSLKDLFDENREMLAGLREALHHKKFDTDRDEYELLDLLDNVTIGGLRTELFDLSEKTEDIDYCLFYCVGNDVNGVSKSFIWRKWRN